MKDLFIKGTEDSPEVVYNPRTHELVFTGRSLQEDPRAFYLVIIEWIKANIVGKNIPLHLKFKVDYFNSSSSRYLMKILLLLDQEPENCQMTWYVEEGDEVIEEKGQEFKKILSFPVKIVMYQS